MFICAGALLTISWLQVLLLRLEFVPYTGRVHSCSKEKALEAYHSVLVKLEDATAQNEGEATHGPPTSKGLQVLKTLTETVHVLEVSSNSESPDFQKVHGIFSKLVAAAADGAGGGSYEHIQRSQPQAFIATDRNTSQAVYDGHGGKVLVSERKHLHLPPDELAFVISHEVAHLLAKHHIDDYKVAKTLDPNSEIADPLVSFSLLLRRAFSSVPVTPDTFTRE
ncbi:hypothetical protein GPECTOR_10g885 [Gonium pectorale]|uniref:Peptidase M48 domain-containing protein n=1 Tax=Gonium pectorale TaxID=33097 RepID=A0A150GR36_GONPE|nr:hypothetical protein GPECTOR_10g885 [Gonium pectorale]|eukprot:KXZ52254.1 hypothetical protein GPECTOR_10g885 [Gonium pectorale]